MGRLTYAGATKGHFDDRVLAHLKYVIGVKLANNESFYVTWRDDAEGGGGRTVIWVHPSVGLLFSFTSPQKRLLNPDWIEVLMRAANTPDGLVLTPEPRPAGPGGTDPAPG